MVTHGSVRIWWDTAVQGYRCATPFSPQFVEAMKTLIPASDRNWDPATKVWTITERFMPGFKDLAEKAFHCQAQLIDKAQAQRASVPPAMSKTPLEACIVEFFKLLPPEAAQKAYRHAAMLLHPDRGGNMQDMSRLNAAWQRIEQELYGRT